MLGTYGKINKIVSNFKRTYGTGLNNNKRHLIKNAINICCQRDKQCHVF